MTLERSIDEVLPERAFVALLDAESRVFLRLANTFLATPDGRWNKRHYYQLASESDGLESFLDDYGARFNRTFCLFRELVASLRWLSLAAFSVSHLEGRFDSYGIEPSLDADTTSRAAQSFSRARAFLDASILALLGRVRREVDALGVRWAPDTFPEEHFPSGITRHRLPRNIGQDDVADETQRIAEVASKYLAAVGMLSDLRVSRIELPEERRKFLARVCTEERARVYEATVHNLQSAYDTHIKNTIEEAQDERLPRLRGHVSASLHLLESVTFLTHFVERHEVGIRPAAADQEIARLVDRARVQDVILNHLLIWADEFMRRGGPIAEELLRTYTNLQELHVELPHGVRLHARPAALIVGIVGHHGTPVELEVDGHRCNAGSILEVLVTVGSHPSASTYVFRGDARPLRDIEVLFESGLGERAADGIPAALSYLHGGQR